MTAEPQLRGIDLRAERVRAGLSRRELALRLGVSQSRVANVEREWHPPGSFVRRFLAAIVTDQ